MPTAHRLINIGLAFTIAATLAASYMLDGPSLAQTEADTAADLQAAQSQARQAARTVCPDATHCQPAFKRLKGEQVAAK